MKFWLKNLYQVEKFKLQYSEKKKLGAIELKPKRKFYDYKAKYSSKAKTKHIIPVNIKMKEYKKVMGRTNFFFKGENHPAEQISWYKAESYCKKLGKRLPTQLEWEKAAKGQAQTKYFWGKNPDPNYAWYGGDYDLGHHPVGEKKPNQFGLFDTSGNVWEWTSTKATERSKFSGEILDKRIAMGGAFNVSANLITSNSRLSLYAKSRLFNVGFRCAK